VATVAAWVHDVPSLTKMIGAEEMARRRRAGREAFAAYDRHKTVTYVPAGSNTDKTSAMYSPDPNFYYTTSTRGAMPQWTNRYAEMGWEEWLDFDGISEAAHIMQPLLSVHSDQSALPDNARRFFALAKGAKKLMWMNGEHTQFYDTEPQISRAVNAIATHFAQTLMTSQERDERAQAALNGTREFFAALEAMDIPRFLNVWAPKGIQEMPYAPAGFPQRLEGLAAINKQYGQLPSAYLNMKFPMKSLRTTDDPNVVVVEFDGSIRLRSGGRYDNHYVGFFAFDSDGKLARYIEYFEPFTLISGFPGAKETARAAVPADEQIRSVALLLASTADARDWNALRALFTDEVTIDYESVTGIAPSKIKADDLIANWAKGLGNYAETKHNFSDLEVRQDGDRAVCSFSGQATHLKANGERWSCGGDYTHQLILTPEGWKITAAKFEIKWEQGYDSPDHILRAGIWAHSRSCTVPRATG
jgi:ketosteroid isomerase-like protein